MYITYILYSQEKGKFYIGHTGGAIHGRLRKHNSNHKGYSGTNHDWVIMHTEEIQTKSDAYQREQKIKGWKNRKKIEHLIASQNPD
ncbi:MAG: GIY-YIG nuclease family protein [Chitinophagales bacterium]|nr:GIY-YIG nuclease family protein [Chitinophagales bacterium]